MKSLHTSAILLNLCFGIGDKVPRKPTKALKFWTSEFIPRKRFDKDLKWWVQMLQWLLFEWFAASWGRGMRTLVNRTTWSYILHNSRITTTAITTTTTTVGLQRLLMLQMGAQPFQQCQRQSSALLLHPLQRTLQLLPMVLRRRASSYGKSQQHTRSPCTAMTRCVEISSWGR